MARAGTRSIAPGRDVVATWPLGGGDLAMAAEWLAEERNAAWLDFGAGVEGLTPLSLRVMSQRPSHCIWVYGTAGDRTPVGLVGLGNIQPRFGTAEAWCVLGAKGFGGKDLTIRAVEKLLSHGFDELGLRCIYAWTVEINRGGRRILERTGFRFGGTLRDSHRIQGRTYDRLWFDLLANEWTGLGKAR